MSSVDSATDDWCWCEAATGVVLARSARTGRQQTPCYCSPRGRRRRLHPRRCRVGRAGTSDGCSPIAGGMQTSRFWSSRWAPAAPRREPRPTQRATCVYTLRCSVLVCLRCGASHAETLPRGRAIDA